MPTNRDGLLSPIERVEQVLNTFAVGREREWAAELQTALAELAQALCRHTVDAESPTGLLHEVDLTRPSLVRQVELLCTEHRELLQGIQDLQQEARNAVRAFTAPGAERGQRPVRPGGTTVIPDFGELRQRTEDLVHTLRHHSEEENVLVLDSMTTTIGVGD